MNTSIFLPVDVFKNGGRVANNADPDQTSSSAHLILVGIFRLGLSVQTNRLHMLIPVWLHCSRINIKPGFKFF